MAWLAEIQFVYPFMLVTLPALMMLIIYAWLKHRLQIPALVEQHSGEYVFYHPAHELFAANNESKHQQRDWLTLFSSCLIAACLCIALAGPFIFDKKLPSKQPYRDTLFLVDTEISMVLRDYLVNGERTDRLTMVLSTLNYFIDTLDGNRIGIIAFSEQAQLLVPMTADNNLLKQQIKRLKPAITGRTSDPANAMLFALSRLESRYAASEKKPSIVMISGVNRPPRAINPIDTAAFLRDKGYVMHVIAIGAGGRGAAEDRAASLIYQPININLLEDIANAGGGNFYIAKNSDSLNEAVATIRESEKSSQTETPVYLKEHLYHWPLGFGLLLLSMLSITLPFRKSS